MIPTIRLSSPWIFLGWRVAAFGSMGIAFVTIFASCSREKKFTITNTTNIANNTSEPITIDYRTYGEHVCQESPDKSANLSDQDCGYQAITIAAGETKTIIHGTEIQKSWGVAEDCELGTSLEFRLPEDGKHKVCASFDAAANNHACAIGGGRELDYAIVFQNDECNSGTSVELP